MGRRTLPILRAIVALGIVLAPMVGIGLVGDRLSTFAPHLQEVMARPLGADNGDNNGGDNGGDNNSNGNDNTAPTATPIPTNTPIPTSTSTVVPTLTPTPTPPPVCTPRPPVGVTVTPAGAGRLQVTLTANGVNNRLAQLRFQPTTNALVDVRDRSGAQGPFTVDLPDQPQQLIFFVRRANAGAATTVPVIVVDGCGLWPTVVGGGPSAF
jgi:hypothetical protein